MTKRFWSEDYILEYYTEVVDNEKILEDVPNPKKNLTINEIVDLLNEQDQKIKELEKANKDYDDAINEISDILLEAYEHGVSNPYLKRIGKVKVENR